VLRERCLVHCMQLVVVLPRAVPANLETGGGFGLRRLCFQVDHHPPEVPNELVTTVLGQSTTVVGDDVDVETREVVLTSPGLGEIEEVPADSAPAGLRMDSGLVLQVRQVALAAGAHIRDELSVDVCEPRVGFEAGPVEAPPFAELGPAERETVDLAEVDAVSLIDESRDVVGVVERAAAYEKVSQSGWPDSNRRLLRPKRSTLTRLSYTP
jgi:hypothetical protein